MPYARYVQIVRVSNEQEAREKKERLIEQAFLGWMNYLVQPTGERRKLSYVEWLRNFGLSEEVEIVEDIKELKKKSLKIAQGIMDMDKGRKNNGNIQINRNSSGK